MKLLRRKDQYAAFRCGPTSIFNSLVILFGSLTKRVRYMRIFGFDVLGKFFVLLRGVPAIDRAIQQQNDFFTAERKCLVQRNG